MGNQAGIIIRNVKNELFHSAKRLILNEVKGIECLQMSVFAWFPKGKWQLTDEKNGLVPLRIYTNRDVTISNHATNDTIYSVL